MNIDRIYLCFWLFEPSCNLVNVKTVSISLVPCKQMLQTVAVLTGGAALRGSGLFQLDQGPHHGCESHILHPPAGLPLADTLLLQLALVTLWQRRAPERYLTLVNNLNAATRWRSPASGAQGSKTYLAAGGSAECPAADWNLVSSAGRQGDLLRVTSGSFLLPLLGDSSRSGWWKRLQAEGEGCHIVVSTPSHKGVESVQSDRIQSWMNR